MLWAKRSNAVDDPGVWAQFGGGIDGAETPEQACIREIGEEAGYWGPLDLHPLYVYEEPGFKYHNFVGIVAQEFSPVLNHETETWRWSAWPKVPRPLHPGILTLFEDTCSRALFESYLEGY